MTRTPELNAMHPALEPLDPLRLDRAIAETAPRARRWMRRLRQGHDFDAAPFETSRWASSQTAYRAVLDLDEADPLRAPLARWVYRLLQWRVNRHAIAQVAFERYGREVPLDGPEPATAPVAEALRRALADRPHRRTWLHAFARKADPTARAARLLEERRQEVASRLGMSSPDEMESCCDDIESIARSVLDGTRDALDEMGVASLADWIALAGAESAPEGWPRTLSASTLDPWFRGSDLLRSLDLDPGSFPPSIAPASTLRALARLGAAWVDATAPRDQPFVVAHDPMSLRRRTMGALLAGLPLDQTFAQRTLGVSRARLVDHRRALARALLLEARAAALRVTLRAAAQGGSARLVRAFEEEGEAALGFAPKGALAGALLRLHDDDGQRLAGLLLAQHDATTLRDTHDEDWYRNPRAVEELRARAALPPDTRVATETLASQVAALVAALGELL